MKKLLLGLFSLFVATSANAGILTADAGWSRFTFGGATPDWSETFTFTISEASTLTVTDLYQTGDQFEAFANGSSLGLTSAPTSESGTIYDDYDASVASPSYSTGMWVLLAGTYDISGIATLAPLGRGSAGIKLDTGVSAVPEPGALVLFAPALLGFLGLRRRSKAHA